MSVSLSGWHGAQVAEQSVVCTAGKLEIKNGETIRGERSVNCFRGYGKET